MSMIRGCRAVVLAAGVACGIAPAAGDFSLSLAVGDLLLPNGIRFGAMRLDCGSLVLDGDTLVCPAARLTIGESPLGRLSLPLSARVQGGRYVLDAAEFALADGRVTAGLTVEGDARHLKAQLRDVDLALLQALARRALPDLAAVDLSAGHVDLELDCELDGTRPGNCQARGRLRALDVAGASSAEAATIAFDLEQRVRRDGDDWRGRLVLEAGTLYLEPGVQIGTLTPGLLLKVEDGPIAVDVVAARARDGRVSLSHAQLEHPGVATIRFDGAATLLPAPAWREAALDFSTSALARFYAIYLQPLLLGSSLGSLSASGRLDASLRVTAGTIARLDVDCVACGFDDDAGRFAIDDLNGGLRLHADAAPLASALRWGSASVYRLALGPGRIDWASSRGQLQAVAWQDVAIFDGALHLDQVRLEDFGSTRMKLVLGGRIDPITLSSLTASFGWPPLAGQVSGTIPTLTISRRRISVDGDLDIGVFGGQIVLRDLRLTDFISAVPRLRTDVLVQGLDLGQLTSTFSFGNIEGHLDGEVRDLRLEAWQPVSFDAYLATPADDDLPHRISRQAVNNLSKLGAGTGGPLASGWLSLIPSYSFGELGFGCRLINGVCHLRGVADVPGGGFKLLTRGGLLPPWIEIRGAGEQIAWQTLLDGVEQIAQGDVEFEVNVGRQTAPPKENQ